MRVLNGTDVRALADIGALVPPIAAAMRRVSRRGVEMPLRNMVPVLGSAEAGNRLGIMAGALGEPASYGAKLLSLFPDNPRHGRSSHSGVIVIFDPGTGLPLGCLDAAEITAMRTAAASAVATQVLARADATVLAILGCGEQAGVHVAAMRAVRPIGRVLVWGRDAERTAVFARRHGAEIAGSVAEAVAPADIVCTTTPAAVPFLTADMLHAGLHVNAAGASIPTTQEIATEVVPRVRLVTDYRPSLEAQAAEVIAARRLGLIGEDFPIAEIGEVLDGGAAGRQDAEEVTLYRSLGVVAQDLAAACFILERAAAAGRGVVVDWG